MLFCVFYAFIQTTLYVYYFAILQILTWRTALKDFNPLQLAQARNNRNWTQKDLADSSGIAQNTISRIERGENTNPRKSTIQKLADCLSVPIEVFYSEPEIQPSFLEPTSGGVVKVSIPYDIYDTIKKLSKGTGRSVNHELVRRLALTIDKKDEAKLIDPSEEIVYIQRVLERLASSYEDLCSDVTAMQYDIEDLKNLP